MVVKLKQGFDAISQLMVIAAGGSDDLGAIVRRLLGRFDENLLGFVPKSICHGVLRLAR